MMRFVGETAAAGDREQTSDSAREESHVGSGLERAARSGDERSDALRSSGSAKTGSDQRWSRRQNATVDRSPNIVLVFKSCKEAASRAVESIDDVVGRSNALHDLCNALEDLWQYRENREKQFRGFIVLLQGLLLDVDDLPAPQLVAIAKVVDRAAAAPTITDPDLKSFMTILSKAGCRVFRELQ